MGRKLYIQILSVFSCFAVVALHVNGCFWTFSYERYWITANIIESLFYFAVPIFFMISGATLINYRKRYGTRKFFKKRIVKAVIPFLIWSLIGGVWVRFFDGTKLGGIKNIIEGIVNTKYINIYWFFPALFSVYLAIPFLAYIPEVFRKKGFGYAIIVGFIINSCLPFIFRLLKIQYNMGFEMPITSSYVLFALIGYWISNYEIEKKYRYIIYIFAIMGLLVHIFGTWYLSYKDGAINQTFKGYNNVPCILYSVGIFLFMKNMKLEKTLSFLNKITRPFSSLTFGIYLIHWFILEIIYKFTNISTVSIYYRSIGTVIIFLLCAILVKIFQSIPFIRRIMPS